MKEMGFDQLIPEFGHLLQDFSGGVDDFLNRRRVAAWRGLVTLMERGLLNRH